MFGLVIFLSHDILDILSKIPGLYQVPNYSYSKKTVKNHNFKRLHDVWFGKFFERQYREVTRVI